MGAAETAVGLRCLMLEYAAVFGRRKVGPATVRTEVEVSLPQPGCHLTSQERTVSVGTAA